MATITQSSAPVDPTTIPGYWLLQTTKDQVPIVQKGIDGYVAGSKLKTGYQGIYLGNDLSTVTRTINDALAQFGIPTSAADNILPQLRQGKTTVKPGKIATSLTPTVTNPFGSISNVITSVTDFLKLIAWLFHPRNLLRFVEFVVGIVLITFGVWAAIQGRGERQEGFSTGEGALSRSGLGRVAREIARASGPEGRAASKVADKTPRIRKAPHHTRRVARQRGMEAAARRPAH